MPRKTKELTDLNQNIGRKIREYRISSGLSLSQLAEKIDVSHQQLYKYEIGSNTVGGARLYFIATALRKPLMAFFQEPIDIDLGGGLIMEAFRKLPTLPGKERVAVCRLIGSLSEDE